MMFDTDKLVELTYEQLVTMAAKIEVELVCRQASFAGYIDSDEEDVLVFN